MKRVGFIVLLFCTNLLSFGQVDSVYNLISSNITSTSADLGADIDLTNYAVVFEHNYIVDDDSDFSSPVIDWTPATGTSDTTYVNASGLTAGTTYYYKFRARFFSPGDDTKESISGSFTTIKGQPSTQVTDITFGTITDASIIVNWTGGDGDNVIIVAKKNSAVADQPTDGSTYTADNIFNNGQSTIGTGEYVVFNGTRTTETVTVTGLEAGTNYHFRAFTYNNSGSDSDFLTSSGSGTNPDDTTTKQAEPTIQTSAVTFESIGKTGMTIRTTKGNGNSRIIAVRDTSVGTPVAPTDEMTYTASTNYASPGSELGTSGYYIVYNGSDSVVTITGLLANTSYYVEAYEYNGTAGEENYYEEGTGNTGNETTLKEAPSQQVSSFSFSQLATNQLVINWSGGNGDNVLVVAKKGSAIEGAPTESTLYSADNIFNNGQSELNAGEYIVYNGVIDGDDASGITISNLENDTVYYFRAFAYNNTGIDKEINFSGSSSGQFTLDSEPTQASSISFNNVGADTMDISWTASGNGSIVLVRETSAVADIPVDATTYSGNETYSSGDVIGTSYVAYNGSGNSFTLRGLTQNTTYHVEVFCYNNDPGVINYNTSGTGNTGSQTTIAAAPTTQASSIYFDNVTTTSMRINWTSGNGAGRIVAVKEDPQGSIINPVDGTTYTASANWTSHQDSLSTSEYYIVYNGTGNSVTLTNLSVETTYWVQVFEYNGGLGAELFNTSTATDNPISGSTLLGQPTTEASNITFSNIKYNEMTVTCTKGSGESRIIVADSTSSPTWTSPSDGTTYTASAVYGSGTAIGTGYVVYSGSDSTVTVTNLVASKNYRFKVYEFNNTGIYTNYTSLGAGPSSQFTAGLATWEGDDGTSPTDWHTGENWSTGSTPDVNQDVVIPSTANQPVVTSSTTVENVTIEAGAYLTINSGTLTVTSDILLESPTSGVGMPGSVVIPNASGNLSAGTSSIQRNFISYDPIRSHFFSSPLSSQVSGDFLAYWVGEYVETDSSWNYFSTLTDALTKVKGYEVIKGSSGADVLTFSGTFNDDNQSVGVTNTGYAIDSDVAGDAGWNLVGNPYPSTINIGSSAATMTNIDDVIYVYNASTTSYDSYDTSDPNIYIAPMQAFFVHVSGSSTGTFGVTNSLRTTTAADFKTDEKSNKQRVSLNISNAEYTTKTEITFREGATELFDSKFDGYKLFAPDWQRDNDVPEIYTIIGEDTKASINGLPLNILSEIDTYGYSVKLGVKLGNNTVLTLSLESFENIPENIDLILVDNLDNSRVSLLNSNYTFTMLEENDDRFEILFIPTKILCESISISETTNSYSVEVNKTLEFSTTVAPETASNKTVNWKTNNPTVGDIVANTGLFSAISEGEVYVIATANDGSGTIDSTLVTVTKSIVSVTDIVISHNQGDDLIDINTTIELYAEVIPTNASNKTYTWSVNNGELASINPNSGLLTAISEGDIIVSATANDGSGIVGTYNLQITKPNIQVSSIQITTENNSTELLVNSQVQLIANVLPENSTNSTVTWQVNESAIASISSNGLLTCKAIGEITITAIANDGSEISGSLTLQIVNPQILVSSIEITTDDGSDSVEVNSQIQLIANILPENSTNSTVSWEVDNTGIATINSTGLLTGKLTGEVTVTANANDGSGITDQLIISVYNFTDVKNNLNNSEISLYPNPTSGKVYVETNLSSCSYILYNSIGKKLFSENFNNVSEINLSEFENGIYYIEIKDENYKVTKKIIKQ